MNAPSQFVIGPTETLYSEIAAAYRHFNRTLFNGQLPECLITLQRQKGQLSRVSIDRFVKFRDESTFTHEISVNPSYFAVSTPKEMLANLAHEMCQMVRVLEHPGDLPAPRYYDLKWATVMDSIDLIPTGDGTPGGQRYGYRMQHLVKPGGRFDRAAQTLLESGWKLTWIDRVAEVFGPRSELADSEEDSEDCDEEAAPSGLDDEGIESVAQPRSASALHAHQPTIGNSSPTIADAPANARPVAKRPSRPQITPASTPDSPFNIRPCDHVGGALVQPPPKRSAGRRDKYACPKCQIAVWGRPKLNVMCGDCMLMMEFVAMEGEKGCAP